MYVNPNARQVVVFLDESYVHHHYADDNLCLYDPSDELDQQPRAKHKARRYCFIGAISHDGGSDCKYLAYDCFVGGQKQTKDYHGMFCHDYFVGWFERLLSEMADHSLCNALIVMDNARYHKSLSKDAPKRSMKKSELLVICQRLAIECSPCALKATIWEKLQPHLLSLEPVLSKWPEKLPIETIWAIVKGKVGRLYDVNTTFDDVGKRLNKAIGELTSEVIHGCIKKAEKCLLELHRYILAIDDADIVEESSSSDSDSS
ncbi:unnamed protein product [Aphanomyces euteiches]